MNSEADILRLRDVAQRIEAQMPIKRYGIDTGRGDGNYVLTGHMETVDAILSLEEFDFLTETITKLKKLDSIVNSRTATVIVHPNVYSEFDNLVLVIDEKCQAVLDVIDQTIPKQSVESISVKLPPVKNLKDLEKYTKALDRCLNPLMDHQYIKGGKAEIKNVDPGSIWLDILVGVPIAIEYIGAIVSTAIKLQHDYYEGQILKQQLRKHVAEADAAEAAEESLKKTMNLLYEANAKGVAAQLKLNGEVTPEYLSKIVLSIETLTELVYRGAEVHPAIGAKEEVKELFPKKYPKLSHSKKIESLPEGETESVSEETEPNEEEDILETKME